ncbi:Cytochrome c-type protein NapC [hydrothermal vent metagenome]|uniref:Cytochrome c-type protein NapC n=1 Tax=hydrothermal vent metagenome TaxID=652676 RepID=A0A3B0X1F8_9ZZZZ
MTNKNSTSNFLSGKYLFGATFGSAFFFIIIGILFWGGFNWSLELTNTEEFCISCHEMRDNVYTEYRESVHFSNSTGVRATCPDCHVPRDWVHKVTRKIQASNELIHHFLGSLDTREKFIAKRQELAEHVWETMKATDSRECRNCHSEDAMNFNEQRDVAAEQHKLGKAQNKTCIDCHKGVAHKLPEDFLEAEHDRFEQEKVPCHQCHAEMARPEKDDDWN